MPATKLISGSVRVRIESADPAQLLLYLNQSGIRMYDVIYISEFFIDLTIGQHDEAMLSEIVNKRGDRLAVCERRGMRYVLCRIFSRPVLVIGAFLLLVISVFLPTRILFIEVEGNLEVPDRLILEHAAAAGVEFGALRRSVRSEKLKNTLLEALPQLQWAGINTRGCVAIIMVSERDPERVQTECAPISHIAALRDGVIRSLTVSRGTPLCSVGQVVEKDQILVSGYTDCGIALIAQRAEAEIYAQTRREFETVMLAQYHQRGSILRRVQKYRIILGKKQINLWKDSGIYDTTCVKMYKETYVTLPGGFVLPIGLGIESYTYYDASDPVRTDLTNPAFLSQWTEAYLLSHMIGGSIIGKNMTVAHENGIQLLSASYDCLEMIGSSRDEEFVNRYGKEY